MCIKDFPSLKEKACASLCAVCVCGCAHMPQRACRKRHIHACVLCLSVCAYASVHTEKGTCMHVCCVSLCVCICHSMHAEKGTCLHVSCVSLCVHMRRSEDNSQELVLSFHRVPCSVWVPWIKFRLRLGGRLCHHFISP